MRTASYIFASLALAFILSGCLGQANSSGRPVTNMLFGCLQDEDGAGDRGNVTYDAGTQTLSFVWAPAKKNRGSITYKIYEMKSGELKKTTNETTWDVKLRSDAVEAYVFAVEAADDDGETSCREKGGLGVGAKEGDGYVTIALNKTSGAPEMGKTWAFPAAHNRILLVWEKSTSPQVARYDIFPYESLFTTSGFDITNPTPLTNTVKNYVFVDNLQPASSYRFIVESVSSSGVRSKRRQDVTVSTLSTDRPMFNGTFQVNKVGGLRGLDSLDLRLSPSVDSTVTGYRVFMYQGEQLDYDLPFSFYQQQVPENSVFSDWGGYYVPRVIGGIPVESIRISALTPDTNYCFVLRAFRGGVPGNTAVVEEENNLRICQKTNTIKAPTFLGVASARAADGAAGFGAIEVSYASPDFDGVWTRFKIRYKEFASDPGVGCPGVSMSGAMIKYSNDDQDFSVPITSGINALQYYCVQVNTVYEVSGVVVAADTNSKLVRVMARPDPPVFNGIIGVNRTTSAFGEMFDSIDITHANATGSFSKYRYEVATSSSFSPASIVKTDEEVQRETSRRTLSGLPKKTQLYARVIAQFDGPEINGETIVLTDVMDTIPNRTPKFLPINTTPAAPANDGVKAVNVVNPITLEIEGQLATNAGATWSENVFWLVGENQVPKPGGGFYTPEDAIQLYKDPSGILDPYIVTQSSPTRLTTKVQVTNLTSNKRYCAMFRSKFDLGGDKLDSLSNSFDVSKNCALPELRAATFSGITDLYNRSDAAGFGQLWAKFPKLPNANSFSRYRIAWEQSPDGTTQPPITWPVIPGGTGGSPNTTLESHNAAETVCTSQSTSCCVKGSFIHCPVGPRPDVAKNKTFFAKAVVEFEFGGAAAGRTGTSSTASARTTPSLPSAPSLSAKSGGSTSIQLSLVASEDPTGTDPGKPDALRGLWNNVFIYLATDEAVAQSLLSKGTLNADLKSYVPGDSDISYVATTTGEWEVSQADQDRPNGCAEPGPGVLPPVECRTNVEKGIILRAGSKTNAGPVEVAPTKTTLNIRNLQPLNGNTYKMRARVVYWNGTADEYVQSSEVSAQANPSAVAPQFTGWGSFERFRNQDDFTKLRVKVTKAEGECTRLEALVYPKAYDASYTAADWNDSSKVETRTCDSDTLIFDKELKATPLVPGGEYYVRVRAVNQVLGQIFDSGKDVRSTLATTLPLQPSLATPQTLSHTKVVGAADTLTFSFINSDDQGDFNRVLIFRGEGNSTGDESTDADTIATLQSTLKDKMKTYTSGGRKGPKASIQDTGEVVKTYSDGELPAPSSSTSYSFTNALQGKIYCFGVLSVYSATSTFINDQYLSSLRLSGSTETTSGVNILCKNLTFNPPFFSGQGGGAITAEHQTGVSCPSGVGSGTHPIKLTFSHPALANSDIEKWQVFAVSNDDYTNLASFGDLNAQPWEEINFKANTTGPELGDFSTSGYLVVGCKGKTIAGNMRFFVRWVLPGSSITDQATTRISNAVSISADKSNFVWIPKSKSGLGYSYLMGTYEASKTSGTASGETLPSEASVVACNTSFHASGSTSSCGTGSNVVVASSKNKTPMTANWKSAWWACRQMGLSGVLGRLPTETEWRRAARWPGDSYDSLLSTYTTSCNTKSGAMGSTGYTGCQSYFGNFDMAGNVREWVDARLISDNDQAKDGWKPTIGRMFDNGIDRLKFRYYEISPTTDGLGLLMGSDFASSANYQTQVDAETQFWADVGYSNSVNGVDPITGFRCMGFLKSLVPSASELAQPQEPTYLSGDTKPEGRFTTDVRPEALRVVVTDDAAPAGKIQISWKAWTKGAGSASITYDLYRVIEPTHQDNRFSTGWGLPSELSASTYATAKPLDPLALNVGGSAVWAAEKIATNLNSTDSNCTATSGPIKVPYTLGGQTLTAPNAPCYELSYTGTDAKRLYMYILVAKDSHGNQMPPMVQRFRTPYLAGDMSTGGKAAFRHELRWRRASIGAVAEAYQEVLGVPQTMVHVPMDVSGFDHDFYIQKYEAYQAALGTYGNNSLPSSNLPIAEASGVWSPKIGSCTEANDREPSTFVSDCNGPTYFLSTPQTVKFGSKFNTTPVGFDLNTAVGYGTLWQVCRQSGITVTEGVTTYSYNLHTATGAEFVKASDWGDTNFDGTADSNPYLASGTNISAIEYSADGGLVGGVKKSCYSEGSGSETQGETTGNRGNCVSRYGAVDLIGNAAEQTAERSWMNGPGSNTNSKFFLDNGLDALWLGMRDFAGSGNVAANAARYDLIRGIAVFVATQASNGVSSTDPSDGASLSVLRGIWFTTLYSFDVSNVLMGGGFRGATGTNSAGRFTRSAPVLDRTTEYKTNQNGSSAMPFGGRCAR